MLFRQDHRKDILLTGETLLKGQTYTYTGVTHVEEETEEATREFK
jgi:hypothetical protein